MSLLRFGKNEFTLKELLEFNDLLVSTVRGGIPMVETLQIATEGASGKLKNVLTRLTSSLERGGSLSEAMNEQPRVFSSLYRETVQSGEQGGFLEGILESFSGYLRELISFRRKLGQAMLYPMMVLLTAYFLFIFVGDLTTTRFIDFHTSFNSQLPWNLVLLQDVFSVSPYWIPIFPTLVFFAWLTWMRSNDTQMLSLTGGASLARMIPGVSWTLRIHRIANFTDLMASMMEKQVPFSDAVQVAARASGDAQIIRSCATFHVKPENSTDFPPFLKWLLTLGGGDSSIGRPMFYASQMYRRRAESAMEWIKILAPLAFLILIAGTATLIYVLSVFLPFVNLLNELA